MDKPIKTLQAYLESFRENFSAGIEGITRAARSYADAVREHSDKARIRTADDALVLLDRMIADWDAVIAERDREMAEREEECRRYEAECEARIRKEKEAAEAARMEMMRKWRVDESRAFGNKTRSPRGQLAALGIIA